jgi:glycoprotein-N-acetylgalactosamine 3-beta-galactosyltransferase
MKFQEILTFLVGFVLGYLLFSILTVEYNYEIASVTEKNIVRVIKSHEERKEKYEQKIADKLFNEVKILCWVFTHPANHKTKVPQVRKTWGTKCNKLLFMSTMQVQGEPDIIELPVENGRDHLWNKTRLTMKYVYENYINDYDWFMRADDDKYIS